VVLKHHDKLKVMKKRQKELQDLRDYNREKKEDAEAAF
jgi:hypothetical protein